MCRASAFVGAIRVVDKINQVTLLQALDRQMSIVWYQLALFISSQECEMCFVQVQNNDIIRAWKIADMTEKLFVTPPSKKWRKYPVKFEVGASFSCAKT